MTSYDTFVIISVVNRDGKEVGTEERFYKTFKAESSHAARELARATGYKRVVAYRTSLRRVFKLWLIDRTYKYWPNRAFTAQYYYLATGMEGIADERELGIVYARCKKEAARKATRAYMEKQNVTDGYSWYHSCISAKPVWRFGR